MSTASPIARPADIEPRVDGLMGFLKNRSEMKEIVIFRHHSQKNRYKTGPLSCLAAA